MIYVLSIVVCIPSTFYPILGHHQARIYYKSDVTFVLAYYLYVRAYLPLKIMAFAFKWVSIISVSSLRHLSTLALVWKLIPLSVGYMFLICSASRICSFCLLFWCSNIVVLSVRIFRNCVVGHDCFFKMLSYWTCIRKVHCKSSRLMLNETSIYLSIYIYILFGPVKPELGIIPSGQENHYKNWTFKFSWSRAQCN